MKVILSHGWHEQFNLSFPTVQCQTLPLLLLLLTDWPGQLMIVHPINRSFFWLDSDKSFWLDSDKSFWLDSDKSFWLDSDKSFCWAWGSQRGRYTHSRVWTGCAVLLTPQCISLVRMLGNKNKKAPVPEDGMSIPNAVLRPGSASCCEKPTCAKGTALPKFYLDLLHEAECSAFTQLCGVSCPV